MLGRALPLIDDGNGADTGDGLGDDAGLPIYVMEVCEPISASKPLNELVMAESFDEHERL